MMAKEGYNNFRVSLLSSVFCPLSSDSQAIYTGTRSVASFCCFYLFLVLEESLFFNSLKYLRSGRGEPGMRSIPCPRPVSQSVMFKRKVVKISKCFDFWMLYLSLNTNKSLKRFLLLFTCADQ